MTLPLWLAPRLDAVDTSWFERFWPLSQGRSGHPDTQGLVLSGGGARGSFQIGALRYLYDHDLIAPTKIAAVSAGSIIGAMLAQSTDPAVQREQLMVLERYWLAMTDPSDMFTEQAWFQRLREQWSELSGVLPEWGTDSPLGVAAADAADEAGVKAALRDDPSLDASGDFNLAALWQIAQALPRIGRAGAGLAGTLRGAGAAASAYRPGPIVSRLLFESGFSKTAVRTSGVELRMGFVGLNSGELRFMRQDGVIVDTADAPVSDQSFDLTFGIWASCAIPGVFRPVQLGDDVYVDGGVRQNVPVDVAIRQLGVPRPYVIASTAQQIETGDYTTQGVVASMIRSMSLLMDEAGRAEIEWARTAGCTVIEPLFEVHSAMGFDPVSLQVNRDYGWMRAAGAVAVSPATPESVETDLPSRIAQARIDLHRLLTADAPARAVKRARQKVRTLVASAAPGTVPDEAAAWDDEPAAT